MIIFFQFERNKKCMSLSVGTYREIYSECRSIKPNLNNTFLIDLASNVISFGGKSIRKVWTQSKRWFDWKNLSVGRKFYLVPKVAALAMDLLGWFGWPINMGLTRGEFLPTPSAPRCHGTHCLRCVIEGLP